jgi:hypothetical protein
LCFLARNTAGLVQAVAARLATGNIDASPSPAGAGTRSAVDEDIGTAALNGSGNISEDKVADGHAVGGAARRTVIGLLDEDAVLCDARQGDVLVRDTLDRASVARDSLDAHAILRVDNLRGREGDCFDRVVAASADGADRETVATGAVAARESDVLEVRRLACVV